jgi:hypothetical protein
VVLAALILEQKALGAAALGRSSVAAAHRARALALLDHAKPFELAQQADELRQRLVS